MSHDENDNSQNPLQRGTMLAEMVRQAFPWLVLDVAASDIRRALVGWAWLGLPTTDIALVGAFGDVFFETPQGILMLDTVEGALRIVAADSPEFLRAIQNDEWRDDVLSDVWVQGAARRGLKLEPGECFDWAVAPVLGGTFSAGAITRMSCVAKISVAGQIHRQARSVPPGGFAGRITFTS